MVKDLDFDIILKKARDKVDELVYNTPGMSANNELRLTTAASFVNSFALLSISNVLLKILDKLDEIDVTISSIGV